MGVEMGRTQLNIRMNADEKDEWAEYAEQSRWHDNLTDFVKTAVREKIERIDGDAADFDIELAEDAVNADGEVLERIQDLHNRFEDLQTDVSDAVDAVHAQRGVNPDLAPDIYQGLPEGREDAVTAEELAKTTGYKDAEVRFALENLRRNKNMGVRKRGQSDTRQDVTWYKTEGA